MEEYYPISAIEAARRGPLAACEHSLRKWRGALPEALAKHELFRGDEGCDEHMIAEDLEKTENAFYFSDESCALCQLDHTNCATCPITRATGKACIEDGEDGGESEYEIFACGGSPEPMIALLERTLIHIKKAPK